MEYKNTQTDTPWYRIVGEGLRAAYTDDYNPSWIDTGLVGNLSYIEAVGNMKPGWFPPLYNIESIHEINDTNAGYLYRHFAGSIP